LTQVSGIAMRIEKGEASVGVSEIKSDNLVSMLGVHEENVEGGVIGVGDGGRRGDHRELAVVPLLEVVGRRRGRKKSEFRGQLRHHAPHSPPSKRCRNSNSFDAHTDSNCIWVAPFSSTLSHTHTKTPTCCSLSEGEKGFW